MVRFDNSADFYVSRCVVELQLGATASLTQPLTVSQTGTIAQPAENAIQEIQSTLTQAGIPR